MSATLDERQELVLVVIGMAQLESEERLKLSRVAQDIGVVRREKGATAGLVRGVEVARVKFVFLPMIRRICSHFSDSTISPIGIVMHKVT